MIPGLPFFITGLGFIRFGAIFYGCCFWLMPHRPLPQLQNHVYTKSISSFQKERANWQDETAPTAFWRAVTCIRFCSTGAVSSFPWLCWTILRIFQFAIAFFVSLLWFLLRMYLQCIFLKFGISLSFWIVLKCQILNFLNTCLFWYLKISHVRWVM